MENPTLIGTLQRLLPRSDALPEAVVHELRQAQLGSIMSRATAATVTSTAFAVVLAIYLTPALGVGFAGLWLALKLAAALPRFFLSLFASHPAIRGRGSRVATFLLLSLALDAAVWGLLCVWVAFGPPETVAVIIASLASVALVSTYTLQVDLKATLAYVVPLMLPMAAVLPFREDAIGLLGAAGAALVVLQTAVAAVASQRRLTREVVATHDLAESNRARGDALDVAAESKRQLEVALLQVQRQSAVKDVFLGTMSHELRTPLHGILGLTRLVQRQTHDAEALGRLKLIESSGTHLLELVGALLDTSRIQSGHLELHVAAFDLLAELRTLVALYAERAREKGIVFDHDLQLGEACWIDADAARLRQVLHNLLGNAFKFTERGLVRFKASREGDVLKFEVSDTGPGIAAQDLPFIFEAFRQTADSAARPQEGTGLGLTIALELARAMGGEIAVSSTVGVGSRFDFTTPLKELEPAQSEIRREISNRPAPRPRPGYRVLLVEDNDVNALIAIAHLEQLGMQTARAHHGKQGVEMTFASPRPNLVLMDCRMPVMDGPTAVREIRKIEHSLGAPRVPVVALTASPTDDDKRECFAAGMDGFLSKPFTEAQLLDAIRTYIEAATDVRMRNHPLYDLACSLDDSLDDVPQTPLH